MIGLLHLVKEFMVGIFSKGVYLANTYVFKQLKNLGQQLLDTLRRDDVVVEVDSSNNGATGDSLISQSNEENVVDLQLILWNDAGKKHVGSEIFDKKLARRDQQIDLEDYLMIYSKRVVDEVKSIGDCLYWPASVEGEASKGCFLQMADSLDKKDKDDILGYANKFCFFIMPIKSVMALQSNRIFEASSIGHGIWYRDVLDISAGLRLEDDVACLGRHFLCWLARGNFSFILPHSTDSDSKKDFLGVDVDFLIALARENCFRMLPQNVTCKKYPCLLLLLHQCSIPILDIAFMVCAPSCSFFIEDGQISGKFIETKLIASINSSLLPELTSILASDNDKLSYLLASGFSCNGYTREDLPLLLDLPLCKTVTGTNKKLLIQDTSFVASETIIKPYDELCLFYGRQSVESVLLSSLKVSEFQDKQISLSFKEKPWPEQEKILIYIYINWQDLQQDSSIIEALKETNFVRSANKLSGDLYKPKDLFDPGDSLLTSLFSSEAHKFPGERYVSAGWLNILRKTGLQNTGDAEILLECAKRIALLGDESVKHARLVDGNKQQFLNRTTEVSIEIWSLAETFIKAVFEKRYVLYNNSFCNILSKIVCIPAEKGFPFESGKRGVKRVLCSYSEAILLKDWTLAWSVAPILSRIPPEYSWGALQLMSPPPFTTVLKHLQAELCTNSCLTTIEDASFKVLKYLDSIWGTLSSSDIMELKQVAFISVENGTRLVTSSTLFFHLTLDLSPLASKVPPRYHPFVEILKELGSEDVLSISCAINILLRLQSSCGYHRLNPNELRAVIEILHFLCKETAEQTSDRYWQSELVVPDDNCRLVYANSSVFVDPYSSRYIKFIDTSKLKFVHHDVSERLCLAFGIKKLSDVVVEELNYVEHLETLEDIGYVSLAAIKKKLLSRSFQVAVSRVFNTVSSISNGSENSNFQRLQMSLESIACRLQFVQCIYTRFLLLPNSVDITHVCKDSIIPQWGSQSNHRALYYLDRSNSCMLISKPPSYVQVLDLVAMVVSHVLGSPVPLPIALLFLCPQDSETALVNILKLSCDERVVDSVGCGNAFLGRDLHPEDAEKAYYCSSRLRYKGEIVAWNRKRGDKLKYGRILEDVRPSAGLPLYRVNLETFPGKTETIITSRIYCFRNLSTTESDTLDLMAEEGDDEFDILDLLPMEGDNVVNQPERLLLFRNQGEPIKELEQSRVSAEELVQAVEGMLAGSGIGMDIEKQSLLLKTLYLKEKLKESQAALLLEQEKSNMAAKEADAAKAALQCQICLTNEIDITLVPCGHVLCRPCSSAVVICCPICRVQLSKTVRIYRP